MHGLVPVRVGFRHLAQQPGVEHLARDRRGAVGAVAAALDRDRDRDGRLVGRRVGDEQAAVAQIHRQLARIQRGAAAAAHHLRGAGLAGDQIGEPVTDVGRGAGAVHGADHAFAHRLQVRFVVADAARRRLRFLDPRFAETVPARGDQVRAMQPAVVGERGGGLRQLQRRHLPEALPDRRDHRVARIPAALLRRVPRLPLRRRQDAADLAGQVDAGRLAEAVARHVRIDLVDAHRQRQRVVVGVDRGVDGLAQVGPAVAAAMRVAVAAALPGQVEHAGGEDLVVDGAGAAVEAGQARNGFTVEPGATPPSTMRLNCGREGLSISAR